MLYHDVLSKYILAHRYVGVNLDFVFYTFFFTNYFFGDSLAQLKERIVDSIKFIHILLSIEL